MASRPSIAIDILTLFPGMFSALNESVIGRAQSVGLLAIRAHNLRDWSDDPRHQKVDDRPYGGGAGMVIRPEPAYQALKALGAMKKGAAKPWVVFLSPQGRRFSQSEASALAKRKRILFVCGHYEGIDERVMEWVDEEISIGDYVLTGGELPAMVIIDAVARLIPGVVGDARSVENESFSRGILDHPHYTRPSQWRGRPVPEVLLSGNHRDIDRWRAEQALATTRKKRPDLLTPVRPAVRRRKAGRHSI